jgi:hypothetical protein
VIKRALTGYETVFDLSEARAVLGFVPKFRWRDY